MSSEQLKQSDVSDLVELSHPDDIEGVKQRLEMRHMSLGDKDRLYKHGVLAIQSLQERVAELEGDLNSIKNMELPMCFDKPETDWLSWYTTATQMVEIAESAIAKAED